MNHSPLPFEEGIDLDVVDDLAYELCDADGTFIGAVETKADARFIVRACNHHEQIVSILKRVVAATTIGEYMDIADDSDRLLSELEADK